MIVNIRGQRKSRCLEKTINPKIFKGQFSSIKDDTRERNRRDDTHARDEEERACRVYRHGKDE